MRRARRKRFDVTLPVAAIASGVAVAGTDIVLAASDTTFADPPDTVSDMVLGTGGQLAATLAEGAALAGSVLRFNTMQLMGADGIGVTAGGPKSCMFGNRVRDARVDVDEWGAERPFSSTSGEGGLARGTA